MGQAAWNGLTVIGTNRPTDPGRSFHILAPIVRHNKGLPLRFRIKELWLNADVIYWSVLITQASWERALAKGEMMEFPECPAQRGHLFLVMTPEFMKTCLAAGMPTTIEWVKVRALETHYFVAYVSRDTAIAFRQWSKSYLGHYSREQTEIEGTFDRNFR